MSNTALFRLSALRDVAARRDLPSQQRVLAVGQGQVVDALVGALDAPGSDEGEEDGEPLEWRLGLRYWHLVLSGEPGEPSPYVAGPREAWAFDAFGASIRRARRTSSEAESAAIIARWAHDDGYTVPPHPEGWVPDSSSDEG